MTGALAAAQLGSLHTSRVERVFKWRRPLRREGRAAGVQPPPPLPIYNENHTTYPLRCGSCAGTAPGGTCPGCWATGPRVGRRRRRPPFPACSRQPPLQSTLQKAFHHQMRGRRSGGRWRGSRLGGEGLQNGEFGSGGTQEGAGARGQLPRKCFHTHSPRTFRRQRRDGGQRGSARQQACARLQERQAFGRHSAVTPLLGDKLCGANTRTRTQENITKDRAGSTARRAENTRCPATVKRLEFPRPRGERVAPPPCSVPQPAHLPVVHTKSVMEPRISAGVSAGPTVNPSLRKCTRTGAISEHTELSSVCTQK